MMRIALWMAGGLLAAATAAAETANNGRPAATSSAGFEVVATFGKRQAVSAWEAIRRIETQRLEHIDPALVESLLTKPETYSYSAMSREPAVDGGEYAGRWRFFGKDGDRRPYAAWRELPSSGQSLPRIELYCGGRACDELRGQLAAMHASREGAPAQLEEWKAAVAAETCESGPVSTPAPRYPPRLLREASGGSVGLVLLVNGCGQVRRAWVGKSSGYPGLDEAAVAAAMSWRIAEPADGAPSAIARTQVSFGH